ncbi:RidA family protein [Amycolatopsis sp. WQ 127309]|uniref:RidA family protein n=1 Tax=Amycolatopsis sp. WQ 127309 TaxID=2932773 RepID=UPI001FF4E087|nr:RidA family protein [Amycolatopsis sp. WQ 127309]UOZ07046.1 RidA family protein [Amycolatopsis sp. WQ 127309]
MTSSRTVVQPASHPDPAGNYSTAVRALSAGSALLFISGQVAKGPDGAPTAIGDAGKQTERIFDLLEEILEEAGGSVDDLAALTVYIVDMADFSAVTAVRNKRLGASPPTSSIIQVSGFAREEFLVEITATALLGGATS